MGQQQEWSLVAGMVSAPFPREFYRAVLSKIKDDNEKFFRSVRPSSLLKRFATPEEVAAMVVYVCSQAASATNGAALRVDGGVIRAILWCRTILTSPQNAAILMAFSFSPSTKRQTTTRRWTAAIQEWPQSNPQMAISQQRDSHND